jgi:hypothetical protein
LKRSMVYARVCACVYAAAWLGLAWLVLVRCSCTAHYYCALLLRTQPRFMVLENVVAMLSWPDADTAMVSTDGLLYIKTNVLPRQARDKHRENSMKRDRFSSGPLHPSAPREAWLSVLCTGALCGWLWSLHLQAADGAAHDPFCAIVAIT